MKTTIACLILLSSAQFCYGQMDMPVPDSATVLAYPWLDNNAFLDKFISLRGNAPYGGENARVSCASFRYDIPVKIHLWRTSNNDPASNIPEAEAITILNEVNNYYNNASTSIRFILSEPVKIRTSDNYTNDIDDMAEAIGMFATEGTIGVLNIHMIRTCDFDTDGFAVTPFYPSVPNSRWNCFITTAHTRLYNSVTLAHELGHALGLLHTHHPGRLILKALNDGENAQVDNNCFQEMRNRDRENKLVEGCVTTVGKKKCGINGDFLCDTDADPGLLGVRDAAGVLTKGVNGACSYVHAIGRDYDEDNSGDTWLPPVNNLMSYSHENCVNAFSPRQIGEMWYYLEKLFYNRLYTPNYTQPKTICPGGSNVTLNNPAQGMNIVWTASPEGLLNTATRTGTGSNALLKAASTSAQGYVTVSFQNVANCDIFYTDTRVWVGKPAFEYGDITGPATLTNGNSATYTSPLAENHDSYQWVFPNGGLQIISGQGTPSARLKALSTGLKVVELRAFNQCGYSYKYIYIDVTSSGGGGGGGGGGGSDPCDNTLMLSPNPTSGDMEALVLPPPGGGCDELALQGGASADSFSMENIDRDGEIVILNQAGDVMYCKAHRGKKINLNLHKLPPGIYIFNYVFNGEELLSKTFIKQ